MRLMRIVHCTCAAAPLVILAACTSERAVYRPAPPQRSLFAAGRQSSNIPGGRVQEVEIKNPYEGNVEAIAEGKRLFTWYNCAGCHGGHGGGGMGPPLMDKVWIYGGEPGNIFNTIVQGRPNGMPSWGGRIPEYQIWEIVAFVRTLSEAPNGPVIPGGARQSSAQVRTAGGIQAGGGR